MYAADLSWTFWLVILLLIVILLVGVGCFDYWRPKNRHHVKTRPQDGDE